VTRSQWQAWLRTPRGVGVVVVSIASFAVGFLPLFAGPGYEHAIAMGLIVPTVAAIAAANEGFSEGLTPLSAMSRSLVTGLWLAASALVTALLHGLRVGFCDPLGGIATFGLTAGAGALLASAVGASCAIVAGHVLSPHRRRRRIAGFVAGVSPLGSAFVAGAFFYFTPAVFAFDPFVGFFSGTLYDEVVEAFRPLLTYRAGTALTVVAIAALAGAFDREESGRLVLRRRRIAALGAFLALGSATLIAYGKELGHRSTADSIRSTLGGFKAGTRCDVVYPRALSEFEANSLLRDCEEQLAAVERRLGFSGPARVTAFFFKDSDQKRVLMGAADTYVAKPWRREVYLQMASYPHPVLGHELAHVVAGAAARGPFRVAGGLEGLLPNPGLIEGIAVAGSPDRDELTPAQWAAAMKRIGILPPLSRTFGSGFLAQNSSMAYTLAGAFVGHQLASGKGEALRVWYGGASFERAFGRSFESAEKEWLTGLDTVALPEGALLVAKARFDRPAIWGRRCPHVVERLRDEAEACRDDGDLAGADHKLSQLLALDEADPGARLERAKLAARRGDFAAMRTMIAAMIVDPRVSATHRNRAREALGDEALRRGLYDEARAAYDAARAEVLDDDAARNLDVKSFLTGAPARAALFGRLLVGRPEARAAKDEALAATIAIARFVDASASTEDIALARYLLVRRLNDAHAFADADAILATVDLSALGRITPRLVREATRLGILFACLSEPDGRRARVDAALARYREAPPANAGRREGIERLAARCGG